VIWSPQARVDLRSIDRIQAVQILESLDRYLTTGTGDVIHLQSRLASSSGFALAITVFCLFPEQKPLSRSCASAIEARLIAKAKHGPR